ncbi:MAG TPA: outer membrane beta-barrel protein [Noviherbaspirillum sp.]|uniref:outer membrane beta-barrel protein n=1 Tax=Noviherbaspirillum sp. TaxID=1926288 RepID=UPI002D755244|nr:outer membrane beta-barrel protein [Noviherbaspirillum sp.]HYD95908.1 outer membrane beta-barrel protein [Noviherbaspirillum sp.]
MSYTKLTTLAWIAASGLAATTAQAAQLPAEEPAEGYLFRRILGDATLDSYGIRAHGYMQLGLARNDNSSSAASAGGGSNFPVAPGDEGFKLEDLKLFIGKPIKTNILPHITPLPGPTPTASSFGFQAELMYGRSGQPGAMFGFDKDWGINQPGASNPSLAAANRQNFLAVPQLYLLAYFPVWKGMALSVGRFGSGIGYEIPPQTRPTPNAFYSRSYAFVSQPSQVAGLLWSVNLARGASGLLAGEIGVVNGWQNWQDNNRSKSVLGALRWRSEDMRDALNYAFITGNEQNDPGTTVQAPVSLIVSPRGQRRQHHTLSVSRDFANGWSAAAEIVYGRQAGDGQADTVSIVTGPNFGGASYNGKNGILSYRASPSMRYSARLEHFSARGGFGLFPLTAVRSNFNAVTLGFQYDLNKFVAFRPEIRYDWQSRHNAVLAFGRGTASDQTTVSADMVIRF